MKPTNAIWTQRVQCPCGDWKCSIKYEDNEQGQASQSIQNGTSSSPSSELFFTPYVGQTFGSDDEAFEHYTAFARKNGFSIRKARSTESQNLGVYRRDFVCYRSGFNQPRKKVGIVHPRERKSVRCGCDAKLYLTKEIVNGLTQWYVSQFSNVHNHELLEDDKVRLLPAYRKMQETDQERILLLSKAGVPVNKIINVLEIEKGVQPGQLPFIEKDIRNFVHSCKKTVQENDTHFIDKRVAEMVELIEACKAVAEKDVDFSFDFTADGKGNIENIAWCYSDSVRAFNVFGDVVQFDMTYKSIIYGLLLGVLSGIDSHGKPVFFGFVLLQEESSDSITWALQTFVRFMRGRHPQTIVTDLDLRLKDIIATEFPNTKHVVSSWYIMSKLSSWFSLPLGIQYSVFRAEFEILCNLESIKDFEVHLNHLVARFGLGSDKHISLLISFRESWAFSYIRECFVARIVTTDYMQSLYMSLYATLNLQTCLRAFFEQVGDAASCGYSKVDGESRFIHLKTCMPIEEHARCVLTPYVFNVFQNELALSTQYETSQLAKESYIVRHYKNTEEECLVIWISEEDQIQCSCKGFEHSGILCRHALRLLVTKNYFQVPDKYFPFRWRRESSSLPLDEEMATDKDECYHALHTLSDTLLEQSLITKERYNYVHGELTTLLDRVRNMSDHGVELPRDDTNLGGCTVTGIENDS